MTREEEIPGVGHDLIISAGDCEFWARCECGTDLGHPIRPNQSFDVLALRWERHVMTGAK